MDLPEEILRRACVSQPFSYRAGNIRTLPGLPKMPNALKINIDKTGEIKGLMSKN